MNDRTTQGPENNAEAALEVLQPSVIQSLERAMIDTQVATAHQYPRSLATFQKRALDMATLDEETAESCIYVRPVGKEYNQTTGKWEEKFAEGPSVRLAEIVGACYGNLRVAARIIEQTERYVKCEGVAHDLEMNIAWKSEVVESTVTKKGEPYSERTRALAAKGALSKAARDALFKVVPRALCKRIYDRCKGIATGEGKPLDTRRAKVRAWLTNIKVSDERAFSALGVKGWEEVGEDQLVTLTGLKTGITDKELSIEEAFPPVGKGSAEDQHTPAPTNVQTMRQPVRPNIPPGAVQKQDKKEAEAPKIAQDAPEGIKGAPEAEKPQEPPTAEAPAPSESEPEPPDRDVPAEPEQERAPEVSNKPGAIVMNMEPFVANARETDALQSVRLMLHRYRKTEVALMTWAIGKKLAKPGQKLADLAESKLLSISKQFQTIAPQLE